MSLRPFHLAIPVGDLSAAEAFYAGVLNCRVGRRDSHWIDFDLFGHQITVHLSPAVGGDVARNPVDGESVPIPHFGVILQPDQWQALATRLQQAQVQFIIEPTLRFEGSAGEQRTMFLRDPSGNALEFKAFADDGQIFAAV